jgi:hypothetical protein
MSRDIIRADFEALFKLYGDKAVKRFNMSGKHPPQLYGVKLGKEPGTIDKTFSLSKVAELFFDGTLHKDGMRHLLQQLTTPGSLVRKMAVEFDVPLPDVVVQINETWFTQVERPEGISDEEFRKLDHTPPSQHPDRIEKIVVFLHACRYTTIGACPIFDKPRRHAEMGELEPEDTTFGGLFSMTLDDE